MTTNVHFYSNRHLIYGNIKLVPVYAPYYPYDQPRYADMWHVPGRTIMSTDALVILATRKGIAVSVVEQSGISTQTTRLN